MLVVLLSSACVAMNSLSWRRICECVGSTVNVYSWDPASAHNRLNVLLCQFSLFSTFRHVASFLPPSRSHSRLLLMYTVHNLSICTGQQTQHPPPPLSCFTFHPGFAYSTYFIPHSNDMQITRNRAFSFWLITAHSGKQQHNVVGVRMYCCCWVC